MKRNSGMTLMELLAGAVIVFAIMAAIGVRTRGIIQRAKVSSARAAVSTIALSIEMMKDDTGIYPEHLETLKNPLSPSELGIPSRFWKGPYLPQGVSLIDPWGNPYYYELVEGAVFGPTVFKRTTGGPFEETFEFKAGQGYGKIIVINEDDPVTAGSIWINGEEVVSSHEFKTIIPKIEKNIYLYPENEITIRLASEPGRSIIVIITSVYARDTTYILGSWGRDGEPGGEGFDEDIFYGETR